MPTMSLSPTSEQTPVDTPQSIVAGGDDALRLPHEIVESSWASPLTAREWKFLVALFWCADRDDWWSAAADDIVLYGEATPMRLEAARVRNAAGYEADRDLDKVYEALEGLAQTGIVDIHTGRTVPILAYAALHGGRSWLDVVFRPEVVRYFRGIQVYALVNTRHVGELRTRLDCLVYARTCFVERRRHPVFKLDVRDTAIACGIGQKRDWSALGRPLRRALGHVARVTGARFSCHAYSSGILSGIDTVEVHVAHAAKSKSAHFNTRRRQSTLFVIEP